jgi:hypothetical protein
MSTLTAANSVITLMATGLFPIPQQMQGFSADDVVSTEEIALSESMVGVDGKHSYGFVAALTPQSFTFQADSPSIQFFDILIGATKIAKEAYRLDGTIYLPATGKIYVMSNGVLTKGKQVPDVKKLLQPQQYTVTWESVLYSPS